MMIMQQAFNDYRALRLLEEQSGRDYILSLLNEVTLTRYPLEA